MAEAGEILRVVLDYAVPGASQALNVFNYLIEDGNPTDEDVLADFVFFFSNDWADIWVDLAQDTAQMVGLAIDVVDTAGHVLRNIGGETLALSGTVGGEIGVAAASGYLLGYTEFPKSRGSKYIPGLGEGNLLDGVLTTETLGDLALLLIVYLSTVVGDASAARYGPGVVRRVQEEFAPFAGGGYAGTGTLGTRLATCGSAYTAMTDQHFSALSVVGLVALRA